jgi:hypothetical protein
MIDHWLTQPDESNAARSMGLYRIMFACTYLALFLILSSTDIAATSAWQPVAILSRITAPPQVWLIQSLSVILVLSLVALALGLGTRLATLGVFIFGGLLSGLRYSSTGLAHDRIFMEVYIPAIMVFSTWGDTYSLDARMGRVSGLSHEHWRHTWPRRVVLLLLAMAFTASAYMKLVHGNFLPHVTTQYWLVLHEFWMPIFGFPVTPFPLGPTLANIPLLPNILTYVAIAFEGGWIVAVMSRKLQVVWLLTAVGFHLFNALAMDIYFPAILLSYAIFINWERFRTIVAPYILVLLVAIAGLNIFVGPIHREITGRIFIFWALAPLVTIGLLAHLYAILKHRIDKVSPLASSPNV